MADINWVDSLPKSFNGGNPPVSYAYPGTDTNAVNEAMTAAESTPAISNTNPAKELLERWHAESFGWARLCCRQDTDEAQNVLQAAYLKILERKAVFDGRSAYR